jgi:hypothetical protein
VLRPRLYVRGDGRAPTRRSLGRRGDARPSDARIPLVITLERRDTSPGLTFGVVIDNVTAAMTRRESVRFVAPAR